MFLVVVGILLAQDSASIEIEDSRKHNGMIASFIAALIYLCFLIASSVYLYFKNGKNRSSNSSISYRFARNASSNGSTAALMHSAQTPPIPLHSQPTTEPSSVQLQAMKSGSREYKITQDQCEAGNIVL